MARMDQHLESCERCVAEMEGLLDAGAEWEGARGAARLQVLRAKIRISLVVQKLISGLSVPVFQQGESAHAATTSALPARRRPTRGTLQHAFQAKARVEVGVMDGLRYRKETDNAGNWRVRVLSEEGSLAGSTWTIPTAAGDVNVQLGEMPGRQAGEGPQVEVELLISAQALSVSKDRKAPHEDVEGAGTGSGGGE
jgi:hypothetical protein